MDSMIDTLRNWLDMLDPRVASEIVAILHLCVILVILAVVFTPLERLFALHPKKIFRKGVLTDLGYYFLNSLALSLLLAFPLAALAWGVHRVIPTGFIAMVSGMPVWARLTASMVVGEVGFYWGHRWSHEIPLLWRFHAVHHSAEDLDFLVSTRAHPVDMVFSRMCEMTPMYVLGLVSPMALKGSWIPVVVGLIGTFWGFFIHANVKWRFGPLEWLISTPAFHHWHHTNDGPEVINKNYAPMLPWVDKLFGTLYLPKDRQPEKYGIDQPISPILFGQLVDPFVIRRDKKATSVEAAGSEAAKDRVADQELAETAEPYAVSKSDA
jgi:sterol desaturase/sphingolipid hydroxylase (fatty acid hydroxylase superfamily)